MNCHKSTTISIKKICWINEFGRLTGYIHDCSYIILVLGNYDGLTDLASEVVAD